MRYICIYACELNKMITYHKICLLTYFRRVTHNVSIPYCTSSIAPTSRENEFFLTYIIHIAQARARPAPSVYIYKYPQHTRPALIFLSPLQDQQTRARAIHTRKSERDPFKSLFISRGKSRGAKRWNLARRMNGMYIIGGGGAFT